MLYDGSGLIAAGIVLYCLSTIAVTLRFLSRLRKGVPLLADDWLIAVALVLASGETALLLYGCFTKALGARLQLPAVPPGLDEGEALELLSQLPSALIDRLKALRKLDLAFFTIAPATVCLIKCSVACLYGRIFEAKVFRIVIFIWITLIASFGIAITISIFTVCGRDFSAFFDLNVEFQQKCSHYWPFGVAYQSIDVAYDLITILLPMPMIYQLQMPLRRKLVVAAIFLIGLLSLGASVASTSIWLPQAKGAFKTPPSGDPAIISTSIIWWNIVEIHTGILGACLPTLRPLLTDRRTRQNLGKWLGLSTTGHSETSSKRHIWGGRSPENSYIDRSRQFSLLGAGVDKAIAGTHSETLPEDIELASNEYYMRHDVEVTEHVDRY